MIKLTEDELADRYLRIRVGDSYPQYDNETDHQKALRAARSAGPTGGDRQKARDFRKRMGWDA